jgi:hypothetical protein
MVLLATVLSASLGLNSSQLQAQASSSSQPDSQAQQTPEAPAPPTSGALTVQARLKARREKRRAAALNDVYTHLYEVYVGTGYMRFTPGSQLQRLNEYAWNVGGTRYYSERLGVTVDGRGFYGSAYIGPNQTSNTAVYKPAISQYMAMGGPTYRFLMEPKYSISGRVMAGGAWANSSGDLGPFTPAELGLYSNSSSVAVNVAVPVEYNVSPGIGVRVAPEYTMTNFGSSIQNNLGFTGSIVVRWGKQ